MKSEISMDNNVASVQLITEEDEEEGEEEEAMRLSASTE